MESETGLHECVELLRKGESADKKPPTTNDGESILVILQENAYKTGLTQEQIVQLVEVACSKKYTDSVASSIIKCLVPRDQVPVICFINIISLLGTNLITTGLKVSFLKWLILVYEWIDDKAKARCLYGILFLFLDNDALSPYVSHVLYFMTKKENVLLYRLKRLQDLLGKVGAQPHLVGLLSLYKLHSPHLVSISIPTTRKMFFKRKDEKWLDIACHIQSLQTTDPEQVFSSSLNKPGILALPPAKRRRKDEIIPSFQPTIGDHDPSKITVDQILTFQDFLDHIDELEFPSQMGTALRSRFLQHLMLCRRDKGSLLRLNFWLQDTLNEELVTAPSGETRPRVVKFLDALYEFVAFVKEPLPCLERCLSQYLLTWNGMDYQVQILLLVSQLRVDSFHKLNDLILEPLRKLFFNSPVHSKCQIICCLTDMLFNLAYSTLGASTQDVTDRPTQEDPESDLGNVSSLSKRQCMVILKKFIQFVDRISAVGLQLEADHVLLQHFVLCFFEEVSVLHRDYGVHFVQIPSPAIIYRLLFASSSMVVSRLCALMVHYKDDFESLKKVGLDEEDDSYVSFTGLDNLGQFNQYILDISDTLWRNKAFSNRTDSLCYSIPRPVTDALEIPHINERFSIQNHPALVYLAKKFLVQTQPETSNLNPNLIRVTGHLSKVIQRIRYCALTFIAIFSQLTPTMERAIPEWST